MTPRTIQPVVDMERLLREKVESGKPSLDGMRAANGTRVAVGRAERPDPLSATKRLMTRKKDPEPKPGVFSPDGYSGGKGGAARLKHTRH